MWDFFNGANVPIIVGGSVIALIAVSVIYNKFFKFPKTSLPGNNHCYHSYNLNRLHEEKLLYIRDFLFC